MKVFSADYLDHLTLEAETGIRLRQHRNIHTDYQEPCQRLFNAIETHSYIRPHR
ncbi:MAG: cupin fold metalloprotein, WbuC family, partial [Desulfobulbaceae bacterium]|nr:cupin fold metalloprotein, WbuC family [Desulfobulbaceae bacterium]